MKILSISDAVDPVLYDRFDPSQWVGINLILACGDLPPEYLSFLATRLDVPLYYVKGNHDIRADGYAPDGCVNLDSKLVVHHAIRIIGLEGSRWYNGGANQYTEREMQKKIRKLWYPIRRHRGVDIVITHAPPRHIHDGEDRCHRGFNSFRRLIQKHRPRYFIHGHIHFNYTADPQRITKIGQTEVVNTYGHFLFHIEADQSSK